MLIPKIIHQTWKNEQVPSHFLPFIDSWKRNHPDWIYNLWTDEMNDGFIEEYYPDFLKIYQAYPFNIQKVDAVRYLILKKTGGLYVDLDFFCYKNITPLLENTATLFGQEHKEHCIVHNKDFIISNALMASVPQSTFIKAICEELYQPSCNYQNRNDLVLETTGPFMLTRMFNKQNYTCNEVKIVDPEVFYPLSKNELEWMNRIPTANEQICQKLSEAYAMHYYWGSWWKS